MVWLSTPLHLHSAKPCSFSTQVFTACILNLPTEEKVRIASLRNYVPPFAQGVSKGMNNLLEETAAAAPNLIARSKGWVPDQAPAIAVVVTDFQEELN